MIDKVTHPTSTEIPTTHPNITPKKSSSHTVIYDSIQIQGDWSQTNWAEQTQAILEQLQKSFPGIQIIQSDVTDQDALIRLAQSLGDGKHLVLSSEFIEQMGQDAQSFQKGRDTLLHLLRTLSHSDITGVYVDSKRATPWTYTQAPASDVQNSWLHQWLQDMNDRPKEQPIWTKAIPKNYSTKRFYTRLARASSTGQVQLIMDNVRSIINDLQGTAMGGSSSDEVIKARRAIRSLRALLLRGSRKITYLQAEKLLSAKKKRAEAEQRREKAEELERTRRDRSRRRLRADANTAQGGIIQRNTLNRRRSTPYDQFSTTIPSQIPIVSAPQGTGASADCGGQVTLGASVAL